MGAEKALEALLLLNRKDKGGSTGCRHGNSSVFEVRLAFLLFGIQTPARSGDYKLPRDLRNAVLSRQSLADLVGRARTTLGKEISRSTVWRMLHEAAIKPWQHESWLFPRDPRFAEKAGPILDLYGGAWEGKPLGPKDYVLSMDEKTSIQARRRCHEEMPPEPGQTRRIETEYERKGALQYLAAWDVRRGIVLGRCEAKTGIAPFGRLVDQVLEQKPYDEAARLFFVVDNGASHRGKASVERMRRRDKIILLVHTPVHASWVNQMEIYFSARFKAG